MSLRNIKTSTTMRVASSPWCRPIGYPNLNWAIGPTLHLYTTIFARHFDSKSLLGKIPSDFFYPLDPTLPPSPVPPPSPTPTRPPSPTPSFLLAPCSSQRYISPDPNELNGPSSSADDALNHRVRRPLCGPHEV